MPYKGMTVILACLEGGGGTVCVRPAHDGTVCKQVEWGFPPKVVQLCKL